MDDAIAKRRTASVSLRKRVIDLQEDPKNRRRPLMDPSSPDVKRPRP